MSSNILCCRDLNISIECLDWIFKYWTFGSYTEDDGEFLLSGCNAMALRRKCTNIPEKLVTSVVWIEEQVKDENSGKQGAIFMIRSHVE